MAQTKDKKTTIEPTTLEELFQAPPEEEGKGTVGREMVGTAIRTGGGMLPHALRIGSSLATIPMAKIPIVGTAASALTGGAGEALAQLIENSGTDNDINWPRVGVEAGLSALPLGGEMKLGKYIIKLGSATAKRAAAKGTALAGAGVVGRKATDDDPETSALDPKAYGPWDAAQLAIGAGIGAGAHKWANKSRVPADTPEARRYQEIVRKGPDGVTPAEKAEFDDLTRRGYGIDKTGKPGVVPVSKSADKTMAQVASDEAAGKPIKRFSINDFLKLRKYTPDEIDEAASRGEALGGAGSEPEQLAQGLRVAAAETQTGNPKIYSDVAKQRDRGMKEFTKEIDRYQKEANAGAVADLQVLEAQQELEKLKQAAILAQKRIDDLISSGAEGSRSARQTVKTVDEATGETTSVTDTLRPPKADGDDVPAPRGLKPQGPKALAAAPLVPEVSPSAPAAAPPISAPVKVAKPKASKIKGTPAQVAVKLGIDQPTAAIPVAPEAPVAPPTALVTPEPPTASIVAPKASQAPAMGVPEPAAASGLRLSSPLAQRVEELSQLPPDQQFARFYRSPEAVERDAPFRQNLPPEVRDLLHPILSQYEAQAKKSPGARSLGELLSKIRGEAGLAPSVPGKARAPRVSQTAAPTTTEVRDAVLTRQGGRAPQELLDRAAEFEQRRNDFLNNPNIPSAQREAMQADLTREADDIQLQILLAEREAELAQRGAKKPSSGSLKSEHLGSESGQIDPELAQLLFMRAVPTVGGAAAGAAIDDEDPLRGAIVGGAAGLGGAVGLSKLANRTPGQYFPTTTKQLGHFIPNFSRGSLLSNPWSLLINSLGAPYGALGMGSAERALTGLFERTLPARMGGQQITGALDEGIAGFKEMLPNRYLSRFPQAKREAASILRGANERGDMIIGDAPTVADQIASLPATTMATGDQMARGAAVDAGWGEKGARLATVTSEPRSQTLESLVRFARTNALTNLAQPFVKTAANVVESGIERIPLVGFATRLHPNFAATVPEVLARSGQSGLIGYAAYTIGSTIDPETARTMKIDRMISNMTGQYGLIASTMFQAGMAAQLGKPVGTSMITEGMRNLPMPEPQLLEDYFKSALAYTQGQPPHPNAATAPQQWLPRGFTPGFLTALHPENIKETADTLEKLFSDF